MRIKEVIVPKEIILLIAFSVTLNLLRVLLFNSFDLLYLLWNIFLAFVPFLISSTLLWHVHHAKVSRFEIIVGGLFWLVLFPNAPYIVTDFIHIGEYYLVPKWFDVLVIFSSAWVGLQLAFYSLFHVEQLLSTRYKAGVVRFILFLTLTFTSFGIYLGRFPRFNSWDILANPLDLVSSIINIVSGEHGFPNAFFFSALFLSFLWVTYAAWKHTKYPIH